MSTERFERTIPYRHTVGTLESIALTEVGKGQDFRLTLTRRMTGIRGKTVHITCNRLIYN